MSLDRIQGMFIGVFLGDALGAPHEFRTGKDLVYTGRLEYETNYVTRFQGRKTLTVGQCTDDTEMTLTLLRTLLRDGDYNRNNVLKGYLDWANSGGWMMGRNTRLLFRGVKTIKGYSNRFEKLENSSQSNGSLMRCSPLALLDDTISITEDCNLTNSNDVNLDCSMVYVSALRLALRGVSKQEIYSQVKLLAKTEQVKTLFEEIDSGEERDIKTNKGWCLHSLWCAFSAMLLFNDYEEAVGWIIRKHPGSDTDTNACIAGALLGAILGYEKMTSKPTTIENIKIVLSVDIENSPTPRPSYYTPQDFYVLIEACKQLYDKRNKV